MQALCEAKLGWDEPLSGKLLERWNSLYTGLAEAQPILVPGATLMASRRKFSLTTYVASVMHLVVLMLQLCIST